ncbi:DUF3515 family protein [Nocardioides lianchengensis]|uniref:DUF3515 domain-containing protein n=1 Tax=Nocardioides lianchengensis TaxID=1045774 RepID=A0A1G6NGI0_9ACTN|nr:DUF3515 family protein [Nocardioides lianchengensis]NYG10765.1 hypothetical protein [Nocardioides lianchengensis]SDC66943.1 Protein of unknown function [Nocardioides lianchengensis]
MPTTSSRRRPWSRGTRGVVACAAVVLSLLTGCGPVELATPDLDAADAATCAALVDDLPATLAGEKRVESEPADAPGAAYGDPAIVVACGAPAPEDFRVTGDCILVNDVGWFVPPEQDQDNEADLVLTTGGYEPRLQVSVPADYRPEGSASVMAELAPLVAAHLDLVERCV